MPNHVADPGSANRKKVSFHLPTETNQNPQDKNNRYSLNDEVNETIEEIEDKWGGSSFEGFFNRGSGTYRMQRGELQGKKVVDLYRRFFVVIEKEKAEDDIAIMKEILERFRLKTAKNGAPAQE